MGNGSKLIKRHQRLAFMDTDAIGETPKYERMTGFTSLTNSKNPTEYSRQYVDKASQDNDVVGYSPSIAYSFDRHTNTPVHERIAKVHDGELTGDEALVDIIVVDLFTTDDTGQCEAWKRTYAIIPDSDGDGNDALIYTGSFKSKSDIEKGTAVVSDDGKTATYTAPTA